MDRVSIKGGSEESVLVIGTVAYDDIITPYGEANGMLGGAGAYGALAASYFAPVSLVGVVGYDFKDADLERFRERGINVDGLKRNPDEKTFYWKGRYHQDFKGRDTLELDLNAFLTFEPELPEAYKDSRYVMIGNISPILQGRFLDALGQMDRFVVLDTIDQWVETKPAELKEVLKRVNLFLINDEEACALAKNPNIICAGKQLLAEGPEYVLVKKGEHGSLLFSDQGVFVLPAFPVEDLRDPTGAGDTFAGALVGYMAASGATGFEALKRAMVYAAAVGSLTVEGFAYSRIEMAGAKAIEDRFAALLEMTQLSVV